MCSSLIWVWSEFAPCSYYIKPRIDCATRTVQYSLVAVHIEDCEGWWLSSCCGSVAGHWQLKPEVSWLRLLAAAGLLHFLLFTPNYRLIMYCSWAFIVTQSDRLAYPRFSCRLTIMWGVESLEIDLLIMSNTSAVQKVSHHQELQKLWGELQSLSKFFFVLLPPSFTCTSSVCRITCQCND